MFIVKLSKVFVLLLLIKLCSCEIIDEAKITGTYKADKFVIRDNAKKVDALPLLILKDDKSFELKRLNNDSSTLTGTWKILKSKGETQSIVQFNFLNQKIEGQLNDSIFYFDYPNDFYGGKYKRLLYVKVVQ